MWFHKRLIKATPNFYNSNHQAYEIVSLVVELLNDIQSNDIKEFQPILEKSKFILNISKTKFKVLITASRQTLQDNAGHTLSSIFLPF